jgi:HPt (histidine-containing phosphotransfer) domain-containing protein
MALISPAYVCDVDTAVPENSGDALDLSVLAAYEEIQIDDEPDLIVELIDLYLEDAPRRLSVMQELLDQENWQSIKREAHSLRGSSGNLGARKAAQICAEIERMESDDPRPNLAALIGRLEVSLNQAFELFLAERKRRSQ